jgi:P27 family predicted phage terminase small subunit
MPGPPPEHPHLRLLKGNPGKRPARKLPEPARTKECPPPPRHLQGYAKEAWLELAPELHRLNLLTTLDVGPFSVYCAAYAMWRQADEAIEEMAKQDPRGHVLTVKGSAGSQITNPLLRIASQAMDDMRRIGAEFGLSPNARLRLSGINPASPPSKFDGLLK